MSLYKSHFFLLRFFFLLKVKSGTNCPLISYILCAKKKKKKEKKPSTTVGFEDAEIPSQPLPNVPHEF